MLLMHQMYLNIGKIHKHNMIIGGIWVCVFNVWFGKLINDSMLSGTVISDQRISFNWAACNYETWHSTSLDTHTHAHKKHLTGVSTNIVCTRFSSSFSSFRLKKDKSVNDFSSKTKNLHKSTFAPIRVCASLASVCCHAQSADPRMKWNGINSTYSTVLSMIGTNFSRKICFTKRKTVEKRVSRPLKRLMNYTWLSFLSENALETSFFLFH